MIKKFVLAVWCIFVITTAGCAIRPKGITGPGFSLPLVYECQRVSGSIIVDGTLNDSGWQGVKWVPIENVVGKAVGKLESTRVALLWDDVYLYFTAQVEDSHIVAQKTGRDVKVWREDCVEFFLDPQAKGILYYELDTNPRGAFWDGVIFFQKERLDGISGWNPPSLKVCTQRCPGGWQMEGRIRFDEMSTAYHVPPFPGDRWAMNAYRVNKLASNKCGYSAWNPTITFHVPHSFGQLLFVYPEREKKTQERIKAAKKFIVSHDMQEGETLADQIAALSVGNTDGMKYIYKAAECEWQSPETKYSYVSATKDAVVPGTMRVRVQANPIEICWKVDAPCRIILLAHLFGSSAQRVNQGKEDGVVIRLGMKQEKKMVEMLVNTDTWQLLELDVTRPGDAILIIDSGPAGNYELDRVFLATYMLDMPEKSASTARHACDSQSTAYRTAFFPEKHFYSSFDKGHNFTADCSCCNACRSSLNNAILSLDDKICN